MIPLVIERWLISGYIERGRPLPEWLERRVNRSAPLRRYVTSLRLLESAFADSSAAFTRAPSPGLAGKIADALAAPRVTSHRSLPLGRLGIAIVIAVVLLSVFLLLKPEVRKPGELAGPTARDSNSLPGLPTKLRRGPIFILADSVERPINVQWRTLTTQTRQSISGFIRALPGLPLGAIEPAKSQ